MTDPQYASRLENVWQWSEWPERWRGDDNGIDLVAKERDTGAYWAIQCKFFAQNHAIQKSDIDSFFTESGKRFKTSEGEKSFSTRLIISTTDHWSTNAEKAPDQQTIPTCRLYFRDLENSPVDWNSFRLDPLADMRLRSRKELRDHQKEALQAVAKGFESHDRGKLIMACGTGKTLTSLRIAENLVPKDGLVLFLAPSISLIAQTLREWTAEAKEPIHVFVICSDTKVGKENEDIRVSELAYPATTDPVKLGEAFQKVRKDRRSVIFSTYQSIQVISDAQEEILPEFDLIVCDEAHRTTGVGVVNDSELSSFVKVHEQTVVRGQKRLYMTATPRIFSGDSKKKADDRNVVLYSMDDESKYGPEFYRLDFGQSVERGLLADYKVLIVAVDENQMMDLSNAYNGAVPISKDNPAINLRLATKIIGAWNGLSKKGLLGVGKDGTEILHGNRTPMRRAVAFSQSIQNSQTITSAFSSLVDVYAQHNSSMDDELLSCFIKHVDGTMGSAERIKNLDWLKGEIADRECRILSNARCLSEGIDVPALDAVIFFDTRDSIVDIVQSVGRVMRKVDGKEYGYIILPVCLPIADIADYDRYIDTDPQFKSIWKVLKAIRAHDESLVDESILRKKINILNTSTSSDRNTNATEISFEDLSEDPAHVVIQTLSDAVYTVIPKKLGDQEYWREWAESVVQIAERLIGRIRNLLERPNVRETFDGFLKGLRENINNFITEEQAIEMLAQHILTAPIFDALFENYEFTKHNPVSKAMSAILLIMDRHAVESETEELGAFYDSVKQSVRYAKSPESRQDIIRNLYDTFFQNAFKKMAKQLGIVYTPVEVVDFIIQSVEEILRKHFGTGFTDPEVKTLDPFTGTGTFIVRLLQSGLIQPESLSSQYRTGLHANEIVLLAYYIAAINIESAYYSLTGEYHPFEGIVLTDTFQMSEEKDMFDLLVLPENSDRVERQKRQDIRVIIANPPYSVGQSSENDNNKNLSYPHLDRRIENTYARESKAGLKKSLYDSYIRAIRWASDRIGNQGVIAFVTNASFIDSNATDGLRKCLGREFSEIYCFNLRGNQRTSGEQSKKEGGKIFGSGSRTPVAITLFVKDPAQSGSCVIHYYDIGDFLSREEKLATISEKGSIEHLPWTVIRPNKAGDWINQRSEGYKKLVLMGNKDKENEDEKTIFDLYSLGVVTSRDSWIYNFSKERETQNIHSMIDFYNQQVRDLSAKKSNEKSSIKDVDSFIDTDPRKISWSVSLKEDLRKEKIHSLDEKEIVTGMYRPFCKQWMYFDRNFNERVYQIPRIFPAPSLENRVIAVTGKGGNKGFSCFISAYIPDFNSMEAGAQCFPFFIYEQADNLKKMGKMTIDSGEGTLLKGYRRKESISEQALLDFKTNVEKEATKEDIFHYVYGILHSPEYRERFASDLAKSLPRIPMPADSEMFYAFCVAGKNLAHWHLDYESVDPWLLEEKTDGKIDRTPPKESYRVEKMRFGKRPDGKPDKRTIVYNSHLTLTGIPLEAYEYVVNGKPAIEWIMDRYQITINKDSGIKNDPNDWSDDPRYILDLVKRVVRVSMETMKIVRKLPSLNHTDPYTKELKNPYFRGESIAAESEKGSS